MHKRSLLVSAFGFVLLVGAGLAAVPFFSSMNPSLKAREEAKLRINLSEVPVNGVLEVDWHGHKVFVVGMQKPTAFLMPYWESAYRLPDRSWDRAWVPCEIFKVGSDGFSCIDPKLPEGWRENAKWDIAGHNDSSWMPDLQVAPYEIQGESMVLSPEYK